jgi:hypothetical protein
MKGLPRNDCRLWAEIAFYPRESRNSIGVLVLYSLQAVYKGLKFLCEDAVMMPLGCSSTMVRPSNFREWRSALPLNRAPFPSPDPRLRCLFIFSFPAHQKSPRNDYFDSMIHSSVFPSLTTLVVATSSCQKTTYDDRFPENLIHCLILDLSNLADSWPRLA